MLTTGVGHVVQRDQALALVHHTFAAQGDNTAAQMALGYRHWQGIAVERRCEDAAYHYRRVAEKGTFAYSGRNNPLKTNVLAPF